MTLCRIAGPGLVAEDPQARVVAFFASGMLTDTGPSWEVAFHGGSYIQELLRNGWCESSQDMGIPVSASKIRSYDHLCWGAWVQGELLWVQLGTGMDNLEMFVSSGYQSFWGSHH